MVDKSLYLEELKDTYTVLQELKVNQKYLEEILDNVNVDITKDIQDQINALNTQLTEQITSLEQQFNGLSQAFSFLDNRTMAIDNRVSQNTTSIQHINDNIQTLNNYKGNVIHVYELRFNDGSDYSYPAKFTFYSKYRSTYNELSNSNATNPTAITEIKKIIDGTVLSNSYSYNDFLCIPSNYVATLYSDKLQGNNPVTYRIQCYDNSTSSWLTNYWWENNSVTTNTGKWLLSYRGQLN